jgi:hypothetical protein
MLKIRMDADFKQPYPHLRGQTVFPRPRVITMAAAVLPRNAPKPPISFYKEKLFSASPRFRLDF